MKKIVKLGIGMVILLFLLLVVAGIIVGTHLGAVVKTGMETIGPRVTQTSLTVGEVDLSLLSGSGSIKNLVLGNPKGYKASHSISITNATISLAPGSVLSDKIIIHSIEVHAPEITFEGNPFGDNNLTKIMDNIKAMTGYSGQSASSTPATTPSTEKKPSKKLEVDDFLITGAKIHANLTGIVNREITLPLPDIQLTDLGKGNDGITAADLTQKVLQEISVGTLKSIDGYVSKFSKNAVSMARDAANGLLEDNTNTVSTSVDKLKKGLGGLFGK